MVDPRRPWLWLPASWSHKMAPYFLRASSFVAPKPLHFAWSPLKWHHLRFANRLGIAGGVDKDGINIRDWWRWGPGFIEVGTITPEPQKSNSGKIMARNAKHWALWNRMGFPSQGVDFALQQLSRLKTPHLTPLFANIGKNRDTPLRRAQDDYISCIEKLAPHVDAFVVNISSPNTEGLRRLADLENLKNFLEPIVEANKNCQGLNKDRSTPLLLKMSPDMSDEELETALNVSFNLEVDGWILTNSSAEVGSDLKFPPGGGVSGNPLSVRSKRVLQKTLKLLGGDRDGKLIVSCGGVMTPHEVFERLHLGADLVQVYSALVFHGPFFFKQVAHRALYELNKGQGNDQSA